jgi:large subunit ribosomal protein L17
MVKNLATSLILQEKITTTVAKAKALQPFVEKLINNAKNSDKLAAIRDISRVLTNELTSKKLIEEIGKRYQGKNSGYTRITHIGFRAGDAAPLVQIELV